MYANDELKRIRIERDRLARETRKWTALLAHVQKVARRGAPAGQGQGANRISNDTIGGTALPHGLDRVPPFVSDGHDSISE